jgi:hypothetical protein
MGFFKKDIIKMFLTNIGGYYPSSTVSYALYPFPYIEKSLTFDWDNLGTDLTSAISKWEKTDEQK